ncbi:ATPase [Ramlibacter sp. PS3R-8]|uniref:ATPase n=1 Tax=Ramlibacter sp. PS3R-8 TaxID=3133437 RepID=UPI00309CAE02
MTHRIALLGAQGTGKSQLAQELAAHLDGLVTVVIEDATALMAAIHAGMPLDDAELHRLAAEHKHRYDATLVTGLDLPWTPDGLQRDPSHSREDTDTLVRSLLQRAGIGYQVVYGQGDQRLHNALAALRPTGLLPGAPQQQDDPGKPWTWNCEKCSDPACEHRLFTRLTKQR